MKKTYLLTPGPTQIPESVYATFAKPVIHHRTPQFTKLFEEVQEGLRYIFQTKQEVLTLAATGTGAMDAAVSNLFRKGDTVITIDGGKFGERWAKIAQAYGLNAHVIRLERGRSVTVDQVREALKAAPQAKAVCFQASETATGAAMPTEKICETVRAHAPDMITVCDAITACGVFDLPMDRWGIDVLITGSQKALMIPPGLSFLSLSDRAWMRVEQSDLPKFYFDLKKERKAQAKGQTAWSPATSLIQGLQESLRLIREEGRENMFARHGLLARATRAAVQALGLEMLATDLPSDAVTAVKTPAAVANAKDLVKLMRDKYGVTIAAGQDELETKIFRLSHFGYCGKFDITTAISCLELALHELGHPVTFGKGVGAALQVFAQEKGTPK